MPTPHLLVAISAHGYGHLSQVAPIINGLTHKMPDLQLTLRTDLPETVLKARIQQDFSVQPASDDFGLVMFDAIRVDVDASFQRYRQLHADWDQQLELCAKALSDTGADLLLADIPYLTLAAAKTAGIPAIAICSLNWFDITRNYLPGNRTTDNILQTMLEAYQSASIFIRPEPSMPMLELPNGISIGPVASPGKRQRHTLKKVANIEEHEQLILIGMGGMPVNLDIGAWQPREKQHLIIPPGWPVNYPRVHRSNELGLNFQDLLASSDLIFTKSGYGTFVESAAAGLPVYHLRRPDWPEAEYLENWLAERVYQQGINADNFCLNTALEATEQLLSQGKRPGTKMTGVEQAINLILEHLEKLSNNT